MVKLVRLSDAFSEIFELEASPEDAQSLLQNEKRNEEKGRAKEKQRGASGGKGMLSLCKCLYE